MHSKILPLSFVLLAGALGCDESSSDVLFDAGSDFSLVSQLTHVGPEGNTTALVTRGSSYAMYLANPVPGTVESTGREHPATGELHIVNAYGADFVLTATAPAYGYGFSPDGSWAIFLSKIKTNSYSLNFAKLEAPELHQPNVIVVIPEGVTDDRLRAQSFFTATGKYMAIGVLPKNVMYSADLHVIDVRTASDVYKLPNGSLDFVINTSEDSVIYTNSTGSTTVGTPSMQGLYAANLPQLIAGNAVPTLVDDHVSYSALMDDGVTLLYVKANGDLFLYDLKLKYFTQVGKNVVGWSTGPARRGPVVWVGGDGSLHVVPKLGPELVSLPPGSADVNTSIVFSPEGARLYWFKRLLPQSSQGELYTMTLPSTPTAAPSPTRVGAGISSADFNFINNHLVHGRNVDGYGLTADVVSANLDGTDPIVLAHGVPVGSLQTAFPHEDFPPEKKGNMFGPRDMAPALIDPVFAALTNARQQLDSTTDLPRRLINDSSATYGALSFGRGLDQTMGAINKSVHQGAFELSDDGNVLAYVGDAAWNDDLLDFVGKLQLQPTRRDIGVVPPSLEGVTEIGPLVERSMFISAPANTTPGIYYLRF